MAHGGLRPPWKVSKEFNDVILVGYQFYSVFSTENESRVDTYLQGVQGQTFMFQFTLRDRNMQVRFGLKVFWEF